MGPEFWSTKVPASQDFWIVIQSLTVNDKGLEVIVGWPVYKLLDPDARTSWPNLCLYWLKGWESPTEFPRGRPRLHRA